jgi:hypothetical protein
LRKRKKPTLAVSTHVSTDTGAIVNIRTGLDAVCKDARYLTSFSNFRVIKRGSVTVQGKAF